MAPKAIKQRVINALLRKAKFKLGPVEFEGPALVIYPIQLTFFMMIVSVLVIACVKPEIILNIIEAATK